MIRLETPADYREVENLTREAFWNVYRPGCTEHYVLNRYRSNPDFIPELDFVMEDDGKIIGRGYNRRNTDKSTLCHAEITAIKKASKYIGDWRLEGCTLYVTLEPCQMCSGAIVQARIPRVVMACRNPKAGCAGSVLNILQNHGFNHQVEVTEGVLGEECSNMLTSFFKGLRLRLKTEKESAAKPVDTGNGVG